MDRDRARPDQRLRPPTGTGLEFRHIVPSLLTQNKIERWDDMSGAHSHDVVIVGGGIAGSALATVLARNGLDVLVLERQTEFRDKVRGEVILPWGVAEMLRLDLEK